MEEPQEHAPWLGEDETVYLDELPAIRKTLEEQGYVVVVNNENLALATRSGMLLDSDACRAQAEWSIQQRKFSPLLPKYIKMFTGYADWDQKITTQVTFSKQDKQLIGLIELLAGTWTYMKRHRLGGLIFIEEPETHVHPKQQRELWSVILAIYKDCAPQPPKPDLSGAEEVKD